MNPQTLVYAIIICSKKLFKLNYLIEVDFMLVWAFIRYGFRYIELFFYRVMYSIIKMTKGEKVAEDYLYKKSLKHLRDTLRIINANIRVEGIENVPNESVLMAGNHQSLFDPVYVMVQFPKRRIVPIAKLEIQKIPLIANVMKKIKVLFLDRTDAREGLKVINTAADYLKENMDILIFPEGTRSKDGNLLEFKKGSFKAAQKADKFILPFVINHSTLYEGEKKPIKLNQDIILKFLKPFKISELSLEDKKNVDVYIRNLIEEELKKIRG